MRMTRRRAKPKQPPMKRIYSLLIDTVPGLEKEENASVNHKLIVYCPIGRVKLFVSDPQMVQDLFQTKNKVFDKDGEMAGHMKDLMGNSFLFSKGDEVWKQKRQATAHAFYKDRLVNLVEAQKVILEKHMKSWV